MASGFGLSGGVSRCYPFWQDVLACYVTNENDKSRGKVCGGPLEDYYECLHHKKEAARAHAIQQAYRKAESQHPRENAPKAGSIRSLGLLGKEEESKKVLESS